jgi:hypothetical protein
MMASVSVAVSWLKLVVAHRLPIHIMHVGRADDHILLVRRIVNAPLYDEFLRLVS